MKIQYVSDLHLEFGSSFKGIEECDSDVLVIAGDLNVGRGVVYDLKEIGKVVNKPIVYVPGNHEYYHSSKHHIDDVFKRFNDVLSKETIFILNNDTVKIDGVVFIGSTGWWDEYINVNLMKYLNDFRLIDDILYHERGTEWGIESKKFFEKQLKKYKNEKIVCVSHNAPTLKTHKIYENSNINVFFNNNWTDLLDTFNPVAWIYGHTHDFLKYKYNQTICCANPMGYPFEINDFKFCEVLGV